MTRADAYKRGYLHGRRLAAHPNNIDHERSLWLELRLAGKHHRAWALGELRGYRQASDRP